MASGNAAAAPAAPMMKFLREFDMFISDPLRELPKQPG